jgi:hypothetical protein|tara:strand:+ start:716 stop:907 length:192 start_codon:yes stop_codon:yes gene_type:complete
MVVQETQSVAIMEQIICLDKTWPFQRLEVVQESLGLLERSNIRIQLQMELALMQGLAITSNFQ